MILNQLCGRLKVLFLSIIGIFRRALCCFSRRRKTSTSECEILETISVVKEYSQGRRSEHEKDWNSWDDTPRTVEEHIEQYRQKLAKPPTQKDPEPEPDFFQDMTPKIKPQPIIFVNQENQNHQQKTDFSRLEAKVDIPIVVSSELEDWAEEGAKGWEELDTETTKKLIREKRKELRSNRQQKSKDGINKSQQQNNFAEKIAIRQS